MKGKQIVEVKPFELDIKLPEVFKDPNRGVIKCCCIETVDQLEDYEIYVRVDASAVVISDEQFLFLNNSLVSMSNNPHIAKDFRCQLSDAKKEGWYFARIGRPMHDKLQVENMQILETLKASSVVDKDFDKFTELNNSGDRENMNMVNKILKTRYEVVV